MYPVTPFNNDVVGKGALHLRKCGATGLIAGVIVVPAVFTVDVKSRAAVRLPRLPIMV